MSRRRHTTTLPVRDLESVGLSIGDESSVSSVWLRPHDTQILRSGGRDRDSFIGAWWPTNEERADDCVQDSLRMETPSLKRCFTVKEELPDYFPESMVLPWVRNERAEAIIGDHRHGGKDGLISIYCHESRELRLARAISGLLNWWWVGTMSNHADALNEAESVRVKHVISTDDFYCYEIGEPSLPASPRGVH